MTETKEDRNRRVATRYDELLRAGKHGHYETLFRVVREEVEAERERIGREAAAIADALGERGLIDFDDEGFQTPSRCARPPRAFQTGRG